MKIFSLFTIALLLNSCSQHNHENASDFETETDVKLIILGNVQDAGSPHIGCEKECCREIFETPDKTRKVVSLGLVDSKHQKSYIFDATPDFTEQVKMLNNNCTWNHQKEPDGIFLTHAHIGHYTGLMYLGKEAQGAKNAAVYAMPKMKAFLEQNGPWSQLVSNNNIKIFQLYENKKVTLTSSISVTPFIVPHRDEFSETVGYIIQGPNKKVLFIPDIDKWALWERSIVDEIANVDYAFIDATFFDGIEIGHRDISEIPHPFIMETMKLFADLRATEKSKLHFIHLNHTNPVLNPESPQSKEILKRGFNVARFGDQFAM